MVVDDQAEQGFVERTSARINAISGPSGIFMSGAVRSLIAGHSSWWVIAGFFLVE
jgi:hypothetical protein